MMIIVIKSTDEMIQLGEQLGRVLGGGEVIELIGDVGAGKTTLTKGIAKGLEIHDDVQSPSFTLSRLYEARDGLVLAHYDFYRLNDAGIMADELRETIDNPHSITVIEWADVVEGVLPKDRITIRIVSPSEDSRNVDVSASGVKSHAVVDRL